MNKYQLRRLEEIMSDNKPRSVKGILDLMWDNIETENKERMETKIKTLISGKNSIPTRQQISHHMSSSPDYDCAMFDKINNRMSNITGKNYEKRYWRIK